jgi:hypothetical protein
MSRVCRRTSCRQLIFCVKRGRESSGSQNESSSHGILTSAPLVLVSVLCWLHVCFIPLYPLSRNNSYDCMLSEWFASYIHLRCIPFVSILKVYVMHPLHPLCIHFIRCASTCSTTCSLPNYPRLPLWSCHPLPSARLPMNTRLTNPLHNTHVRSFLVCFCKFSPIFSISGADENRWKQHRYFTCPLCPFCIRFVSICQWDRAFSLNDL